MARASQMLAHMDFRSASCKMHIVHIRFDQRDAAPAAAADVNLFFRVLLIAVYYGISQSFPERQLDVELISRNTLRSFNQSHQAIYSR